MLIVTAHNVTEGGPAREDGTADYDVWLGINQHCIWAGSITGHVRNNGAAELLHKIATAMERHPRSEVRPR